MYCVGEMNPAHQPSDASDPTEDAMNLRAKVQKIERDNKEFLKGIEIDGYTSKKVRVKQDGQTTEYTLREFEKLVARKKAEAEEEAREARNARERAEEEARERAERERAEREKAEEEAQAARKARETQKKAEFMLARAAELEEDRRLENEAKAEKKKFFNKMKEEFKSGLQKSTSFKIQTVRKDMLQKLGNPPNIASIIENGDQYGDSFWNAAQYEACKEVLEGRKKKSSRPSRPSKKQESPEDVQKARRKANARNWDKIKKLARGKLRF